MKLLSQFLEEKKKKKKKKKEEKTSPVEPMHTRIASSKLKRHRKTHGKNPAGTERAKRAELEGEIGTLETNKLKRVYRS